MPSQIAALAAQQGVETAQNIINEGMGLMLGKVHDKRQLKQQSKLQDLSIKGSKELTDYNYAKQLQMWRDTNYSAQMEEMEKAGLNPGLIYGMSGGGATTTGSGSGASTTQGHAPVGGGEAIQAAGMGIQMKLANTQAELMQAQAEKTKAETTKIQGVDTTKTQMEIESLSAGIANTKTQQELNEIQADINKTQLDFTKASWYDNLEIIHQQAREMMGRATQALVKGNVDTNTREIVENKIAAEYTGQLLQNNLLRTQEGKIKSDIQVNKAQINKWATELTQGWLQLSMTQKMQKVDALMKEVEQMYKGTLGHMRTHDPYSIAKQIDEIMNLKKEDFNKK